MQFIYQLKKLLRRKSNFVDNRFKYICESEVEKNTEQTSLPRRHGDRERSEAGSHPGNEATLLKY